MKSIKLLAALAIPAMFAACTNEEILIDTPQKMQEVVGEELVGTGISLNATKGDLGSRMVQDSQGNWGWADTDKLGLGWIVNTGPTTKQTKENTPNLNGLYANNLFEVEDASGKFTTKGNIYKGWHFAYFPYAYQEEVTENMIIDINPAVKKDVLREDQAFYISARKFLTKDSLDSNYQLAGKPFAVQNTVNTIWVRMTPGEGTAFVNGGSLDSLAIQKVTINVGKKVFTDSIKLQPSNLPADTTTNEERFDLKEKLLASLYNKTNPVMANNKTELEESLETDVAGAGFVTCGTNIFAAYTIPGQANLDLNEISIVIEVAGGKFTIKNKSSYLTSDPNAAFYKKNNDAIEALYAAYASNGVMNEVQGQAKLDVVLYGDIFETDFDHISNHTEWVGAVAMVNALERTQETFKIDGVIEFPNDTLELPRNCKLTVGRAEEKEATKWTQAITICGNLESWPSNLVANVNLMVADTATIADATAIDARTIYNYGTLTVPDGQKNGVKELALNRSSHQVKNFGIIKLGEYAKAKNIDNARGRIEVVYGSYVELKAGTDEGVIAYNVTGEEKVWMINNLVSNNNVEGNALVNTLVIKDKSLDLNDKDVDTNGSYDPYTGAVAGATGATLADLSNVTVELYNGIIAGAKGANQNVGTVKALKIEDETSTENWIGEVFPANVEIAEGAILNIGSVEYETLYTEANVVNEGTLKVNVTTYINELTNSGTVEVASGCTLYYGSQSSTGTIRGNYEKGDAATAAAEELVAAIAAAEDGDVVTLNGNAVLEDALEINKQITLDLNGNDIEANTPYDTNQDMVSAILVKEGAKLTIDGEGSISGGADNRFNIAVRADAGEVTIKNGKFYVGLDESSSNNQQVIYATGTSTITIEGGEFMVVGNDGKPVTTDLKYLLNQKDTDRNTSKIIVKGGTFYGFNPSNNSAEGENTNFVPNGYVSTETESGSNIWVVTEE